MREIKLFITDIDGVWTDGSMYYTELGFMMKKFHTYDSAGVLFLKLAGIPLAIVSGEASVAVHQRADKLGIKEVHTGVKDKVKKIEKLLIKYNVSWEETAYIGDDLNDIKVFEKAGLTACPAQSTEYIKKLTDWPLSKKGGEGVFREFVEKYLREQGKLEEILNTYLNQ